jgi:hypothetical protein
VDVHVVDVPKRSRFEIRVDGDTAGESVLPFCPFVRSYIAGHDEYLDLVPSEMRARFQLTADV